jgi:hypothetical protein
MAKSTATKSATVNPFAAAAKKSSTSASKPARSVFIAEAHVGPDGRVLYTKDDVIAGIENYVEGHTMFEQGKAMKDTNRPIVLDVARLRQSKEWLTAGRRPENPSLTTREDGDGTFVKVIFMDSVNKLDDFQFGQLAQLIGQKAANENTIHRHEFAINPELLDQDVQVNKDGGVVTQNVLEAMTEALQEKFGPSPEILAGLFKAVDKFHTKKGLIDKGLQLVGANDLKNDAYRLAQFLELGRFTTQIKTGAKDNE